MSKSLGNVISPKQLIDLYGVDGSRYLIARSFPSENDSDVGLSRFTERYNADLANNLGNLVSRVTKLAQGYEVPKSNFEYDQDYSGLIDTAHFDDALGIVFAKWIDASNSLLNTVAPWKLAPDDPKRKETLDQCISNLLWAAYHLEPFMPETAKKIKSSFENKVMPLEKPLFPRIQEIKI
jgi:methionyl-tRNA synthetase